MSAALAIAALPVPPAPLRRRTDWRQRLRAFALSRHREPFAWGQNDCALFAADATAALTGHDFGAPFRGTYASAREALRVLHSKLATGRYPTVVAVLNNLRGAVPPPTSKA